MMFVFVWARSSVNPSQSFHLGNPMPSSHEPTLRVDWVENPISQTLKVTKGHQSLGRWDWHWDWVLSVSHYRQYHLVI